MYIYFQSISSYNIFVLSLSKKNLFKHQKIFTSTKKNFLKVLNTSNFNFDLLKIKYKLSIEKIKKNY